MKKKAIGIAAAVLALAAGFFLYTVWSARAEASAAVDAYNAAARDYNDAIAPYNQAAADIAEANGELQAAVDSAQAVLDKGEEAYEPDTQDLLESAVQKAEKAFAEVPVQIDPFEMRNVPAGFSTDELELAQHEAETAQKAVEESLEKIPEVPEVPDYTQELEAVRSAQKNFEKSVRKLANITSPPDSFVKERLERIDTVVQAEAVTAGNDPNGLLGTKGGYLGCVYFLDERIDRSLLPQEAFEKDGKKSSGDEQASESSSEEASSAADSTAAETAAAEEGGTAAETGLSAEGSTAAEAAAPDAEGETAAEAGLSAEGGTAAESGTPAESGTAAESGTSAESGTAAEAGISSEGGTAAQAAAAPGDSPKKNPSIDVVMIGTAGGGAVEIYSSREEAEKRAEYISFFDGSVMDAGSCAIEGTCLIRTSKYLDEEGQEKLTQAVREALLTVDE
jgi:tetratricopeptide (TPR) repeat protein